MKAIYRNDIADVPKEFTNNYRSKFVCCRIHGTGKKNEDVTHEMLGEDKDPV